MPPKGDSLLIVGGGIIGLSTAYYALRAGFQVTLVEREAEAGDNCSRSNAGMIVPSHFTPLAAPGVVGQGLRWLLDRESPFAIRPSLSPAMARWGWLFWRHANARHVASSRELLCRLHLESRQLFEQLAQVADIGLQTRGLLMLCREPSTLEEEAKLARQACELGLQAEVLGPAQIARLDPGIRMKVAGGVHYAEDAHLDPGRVLQVLTREILAMGGRIHHDWEVHAIRQERGRVRAVSGPKGDLQADHYAIAGGAWSAGLLRSLRIRLPLQPGKGYSLTLPKPAQLPTLCSILTEARLAVTPIGDALRIAGTMEIGDRSLEVDPRRLRGIIKSVPHYFPAFEESDFETLKPWVGLRPVSPDGLPYLGLAPGLDNLIIASGHAMMGLSLGPITGKRVAGMLAGEAPIPQLDPARFE